MVMYINLMHMLMQVKNGRSNSSYRVGKLEFK